MLNEKSRQRYDACNLQFFSATDPEEVVIVYPTRHGLETHRFSRERGIRWMMGAINAPRHEVTELLAENDREMDELEAFRERTLNPTLA